MRQVALITLLLIIGSFVPAQSAERSGDRPASSPAIGAADYLAGRTFHLQLVRNDESAAILNNAPSIRWCS